eukprot:Rhum_TRINITY_DN14681_c4_g1::Rhum_TRINITY_DN14681_c4_g1_i1::g.109721::m.109721
MYHPSAPPSDTYTAPSSAAVNGALPTVSTADSPSAGAATDPAAKNTPSLLWIPTGKLCDDSPRNIPPPVVNRSAITCDPAALDAGSASGSGGDGFRANSSVDSIPLTPSAIHRPTWLLNFGSPHTTYCPPSSTSSPSSSHVSSVSAVTTTCTTSVAGSGHPAATSSTCCPTIGPVNLPAACVDPSLYFSTTANAPSLPWCGPVFPVCARTFTSYDPFGGPADSADSVATPAGFAAIPKYASASASSPFQSTHVPVLPPSAGMPHRCHACPPNDTCRLEMHHPSGCVDVSCTPTRSAPCPATSKGSTSCPRCGWHTGAAVCDVPSFQNSVIGWHATDAPASWLHVISFTRRGGTTTTSQQMLWVQTGGMPVQIMSALFALSVKP